MDQGLSMDIRDIFYIIRKRIILILTVTMLCALSAGILSFYVIKPTYQAKTSMIVGKSKSETVSQNYNDVIMYQNLVKTYSEIAKSRIVSENARARLKFEVSTDQIQNSVTVTTKDNTQILYISAESKDASQAVNITNAMALALIEESKKVYPTGGDIQIMDTAQYPSSPVRPRKVINIAIAVFLGIFVSMAMSFILEYMDRTIKTEDDVDKYLGLPVIGVIPRDS